MGNKIKLHPGNVKTSDFDLLGFINTPVTEYTNVDSDTLQRGADILKMQINLLSLPGVEDTEQMTKEMKLKLSVAHAVLKSRKQ